MLSPRDKLIEDFGLFFENYGLPRIFGRMYGLLMLSDEPHLSLEQIAEGLKISKASASTMARQLQAMTMIAKSTVPGDRRDYYRVTNDSHIKTMHMKLNAALALSSLIQRGAGLKEVSPQTQARLERTRHFYDELAVAIDHFFENYRPPQEVEHEPAPSG
ncbi:MAG: MarR family transcriptional regulator [Thermaceae bacterium]|nr:MarR family transcriptional regulator [Thermaceae bacterium]